MTAHAASLLAILATLAASPGALAGEPPEVPDPPGAAAGESSAPKTKPPFVKTGGKLVVSADRAHRRRLPPGKDGTELSRVSFTGKVAATRGGVTLTCQELEVTFAKPPAKEGEKPKTRARDARARGRVIIRTERRRAVAERADYDFGAERFTLSGKKRPVIYQDGDAVAAESFTVHRRLGRFEARGKTSAVIRPRKKAGEPPAKDEAPPARAEKGGPSLSKKTRIDSAGGAVYDEGKRWLFLRGDVLVRQKGFQISCERLWVIFAARKKDAGKSKEAGGEKKKPDPLAAAFRPGSVERIVAAGHVRIRSATRTAEAELAIYDPARGTFTLTGKRAPVIRDGENHLTAPEIVYHLKSDKIESRGGPFKAVLRGKKPGSPKLPGDKGSD